MNNIKIAIIDSGLKFSSEVYKKKVIGGIEIQYLSNRMTSNIDDQNGHGTYCADIITNINPNVQLYIVKILNKDALANHENLISALEYLVNIDVKIINLSLSTQSWEEEKRINMICGKLVSQGKIIISALANRQQSSLPAVLDNVIGVRGNNNFSGTLYKYNKEKLIQCECNAEPVILSGVTSKYGMIMGNSKATAEFTGFVSKIVKDEDYFEIQEKLHNTTVNYEVKKINFLKAPDEFVDECGEILCGIAKRKIDYSLRKNPNFLFMCGLNTDTYSEFLEKCEEHWGRTLNTPILYKNIFAVDYLYHILLGGN